MWERLSEPWRCCLEEAWAAYCAGSVPVGAVVTEQSGRVLSRGRNHTLDRAGMHGVLEGHPLAHAEVNALIALDYGQSDPHTCVLFTTAEPCPLCFGALYMSGVRELRYASRDPYAGSVDLLGTTPYLSRKPIRIVHPESVQLETVITAMATEFIMRMGVRAGPDVVLGVWNQVVPRGVQLGEALLASGWLEQMRRAGAAVSEVIDGLAAQAGTAEGL